MILKQWKLILLLIIYKSIYVHCIIKKKDLKDLVFANSLIVVWELFLRVLL